MSGTQERTFIMIKPDGVHRGLIGKIITRFERHGFKLVAMKFIHESKDFVSKHYQDLSSKPFFKDLVDYVSSGPVVAMVWEGRAVVSRGRKLLGETDPQMSAPGTIRGDFAITLEKNICHGSDSIESANKEIALWFKKEEIFAWESCQKTWIY